MTEERDWDSAQSFRLFLGFALGLSAYVGAVYAFVRWLRLRP